MSAFVEGALAFCIAIVLLWGGFPMFVDGEVLSGLYRQRIMRLILLFGLLVFAGCGTPNTQTPMLRGRLSIVGSTALQPLATKAAVLFQKLYPQVHVDVRAGGSVDGLNAVTSNAANIGDSIIYADLALYPDPNLTDHIVSVIPFAIIVNRDVSVTSLTTQQLMDIFATGKYQNWHELGGPSLPIVPIVSPATAGVRAIFHRYVLEGNNEQSGLLAAATADGVLPIVAETPGAIGYLALPLLDASVRPVAINDQQASAYSVEAGIYPFWSYGHMYTLGDDSPLLVAYLNFMLGNEIQHLAQTLHYIPVSDVKPTS